MFFPPLELRADGAVLPRCAYLCKLCSFYNRWHAIVRYNVYVGIVSPNLWLLDFLALAYVLWFYPHDMPCSHPHHHFAKDSMRRHLGHCALGMATYSGIVGAIVLYTHDIGVVV